MKSFATAEFWKAYAELSPEMQEQARKAYQPDWSGLKGKLGDGAKVTDSCSTEPLCQNPKAVKFVCFYRGLGK